MVRSNLWMLTYLCGMTGCLALVVGTPLGAARVHAAEGFSAARADAVAAGRPLAVLVHGSTWQGESRRLLETVWRSEAFRAALREPFVITEISVRQNADDGLKQAFAEETQGWDASTVQTFPAVQVFGSDGRLVKTLSGRSLRGVAASPGDLATAMNELTEAVRRDQARSPDAQAEASQSPVAGWDFVRSINGRLGNGESAAALDEVELLLADDRHAPAHRCLLLAAKGMALAALDRPDDAWQAYLLAHAWDPDDVNGKAVMWHAYRTVGAALRVAPSLEVLLDHKAVPNNLSRDRATVSVLSPDPRHDNPSDHASLFSGPLKEFAFHSAQMAGPAAFIDLREECRIDAIQIVNRTTHQDRADGLTVWLSSDAITWQEVWRSPTVASEWIIDFLSRADEPPQVRYLKVGLPKDRTGILHLRAVNVFGGRPGDEPASGDANAGGTSRYQLPLNTAVALLFDPSRIDMRAVVAHARNLLESESRQAGVPGLQEAADAVFKYAKPITWRSTNDERVKGIVSIITPTTVTIEHDGQVTTVDRKRFSAGSQKVLATMESRAKTFLELVNAGRKPLGR